MSNLKWARSALFVPLYDQRWLDSKKNIKRAAAADVLILDLEDSLKADQKADGRNLLVKRFSEFKAVSHRIWVRINGPGLELELDLQALRGLSVEALVVPKIKNSQDLELVTAFWKGPIVPLIETPEAVFEVRSIAKTDGVSGLMFGPEDFSAALGVSPGKEALGFAAQMTICAAAEVGVPAIGLAGNFRIIGPESVAPFREICEYSKTIGFHGGYCIHSSQLSVLNEVFSIDEASVRRMKEILCLEKRNSVFMYGFEMIGPPVIRRIQNILARIGLG